MTSKSNIRTSFSKATLRVLSKSEYYDVIIMIGNEVSNPDDNLSPKFIRNKLNLTKKECNSWIAILMSHGFVDLINNQYMLTTLGKNTFESLRLNLIFSN
jgi:predicted transcriptional regulator